MDLIKDNEIKTFKCTQCNIHRKHLLWKDLIRNPGFICEDCWKIYDKRIKSLF